MAALVDHFDSLWERSNSGQAIEITLTHDEYDVPTLVLNESAVVSEVWIVAAAGTEVVLRAVGNAPLLETTPGAPRIYLIGLRMRGRVSITGSRADLSNCTIENGTPDDGAALALLSGASLRANSVNFSENLGGAMLVEGSEANLTNCRFEANEAPPGRASAIHVLSTMPNGIGVLLRRFTIFLSGQSVSRLGDSRLRYELPAPRGRFIDAPGGSEQQLTVGIAGDYPYSCGPGVSGDSTETSAQNGPWCFGLCPAGKMCPGATGAPLPCSAGGFCAGKDAFAAPCPAGT